jgi:hypothetical protein
MGPGNAVQGLPGHTLMASEPPRTHAPADSAHALPVDAHALPVDRKRSVVALPQCGQATLKVIPVHHGKDLDVGPELVEQRLGHGWQL